MIAAAAQTNGWSRRRLWVAVFVLFLLQLGFIVWFDQPSAPARKPAPSPALGFAGKGISEWLLFNDPTLFALPNEKGFAGPAWLHARPLDVPRYDWTEPRQYLPYRPETLGLPVVAADATNVSAASPVLARPDPPLTMPTLPIPSPFEGRSVLRLTGGLSQRKLVGSADLPNMAHTDILTNTVVQLLVDAEGRPFSWTLLQPGSGLKTADDYALERVKTSRFEPIPTSNAETNLDPSSSLSWGLMVFQWHTVPPSRTNAPAGGN